MKYVSPKSIKVSTTDGIHAFFLPAGEPREVPEHLVAAAVVAGARPFVEAAVAVAPAAAPAAETAAAPQTGDEAPQVTEADAAVEMIADAMSAIMAEGNPELLTAAGIPRVSEVETRCGFDTTKEQRDEAWAIVEG